MKNLTAAFLAVLLFSCAGPQIVRQPSPQPPDCWLLQPVIYRLRQSAQLEYQEKKEMLEGFMELDLTQNRAHLVIFSALGLTLLNIEIERHSYQIAKADCGSKDELPPSRRKQQFAAAVATAVQHIFFSLGSGRKDHPGGGQSTLAEFSDTPPILTKISENRQKPTWSVTYHDYTQGSNNQLPSRIILQNHKPDYRLTIWLHKAEVI